MADSDPFVTAESLVRHFRVQEHAGRIGRFGIGLIRRQMRTVKAVDDVTFSIPRTTAVGLIGLNGAGKSTLIKLITGVLVPTSGSVTVDGLEPSRQRKQVAQQIGLVFGQRTQLWWDVSVLDSYNVLRRIYSTDRESFEERLKRFSKLLEMDDLLARSPRQLSLGQRVRADILAGLLHGPRLVILDEPTVGLDIIAKAKIRGLVRSLVEEEGVTVILASHEIRDIEEVCDLIILIHEGKILFQGTLDELRAQAGVETSLVVEVVREDARIERTTVPLASSDIGKVLTEATQRGAVSEVSISGGALEDILATMFREPD